MRSGEKHRESPRSPGQLEVMVNEPSTQASTRPLPFFRHEPGLASAVRYRRSHLVGRRSISVLVLCMALPLAACVRSPDGSIEPRYVPEVRKAGPVPLLVLAPNRRDPRNQFPHPPSSPYRTIVSDEPLRQPRQIRREAPPRPLQRSSLSCRQVPAGNRVRWECA